jgi:saccharopine dehydrogenase (NAD+, L-lysine forming)
MIRIGIIREQKNPPDSRTAITPEQAVTLQQKFDCKIIVQPAPTRCFSDHEYADKGIELSENMEQCDYLLGVKEVPIDALIPNKAYFFFSHTIKKQAHNRELLIAVLQKNITLIDYEVVTDEKGNRLIAFGEFAGMVGAHNGVYAYGRRTGLFQILRMKEFLHYEEAAKYYQSISLPPMRILLTGTGRVGTGAAKVLRDMGIREVDIHTYIKGGNTEPVFLQLGVADYVQRKNREAFVKQDFYKHPEEFESALGPYLDKTDLLINGIYWDKSAPPLLDLEDMNAEDFNIEVIADVTCDIAPDSSIPSTLRASTIQDPVYGFDPVSGTEKEAYNKAYIDIMAIDNLPNELPRDASEAFGKQFIDCLVPEIFSTTGSPIIDRATIAKNGSLCDAFKYLEDYVSAY